ncbi:putative RNA methyltransferase [Marinobacter alexandrii]|jgi:23S rRNA (guanine745-N1)-methyltransferase|uniref:putative RNA methyltransferase n=1 Tax=Marinobacter alexandrii TaxID=2570351 RepID=UPI00110878F4|nr:methyltransferase domain-containing protein [Marinobacter alexandrii]MCK2147628.1 methyltransferase domain-containing protein [Marinobacter alexandrii]
MSLIPFDALACPLDGQTLHRDGKSWRCEAGHSYDIARQGYVHLLPVQKKRSRDPGDSKDMVAARQRFLNAGFYNTISDAVNRAAAGVLPEAERVRLLDAGCGEGHYTRRLAESLPETQEAAVVGLDISKWAVLAAAKQDKRISWVVGSNANLPVLPGTLDAVLCLFGFPVYGEFHRVLKSGGLVLQVDAGPDHLRELREIIYPELKPERPRNETAPEGFRLVASEPVRHTLTLTGQTVIADLLAMTPHLYRASAEGRARAANLSELTVTVDVTLQRFAKL